MLQLCQTPHATSQHAGNQSALLADLTVHPAITPPAPPPDSCSAWAGPATAQAQGQLAPQAAPEAASLPPHQECARLCSGSRARISPPGQLCSWCSWCSGSWPSPKTCPTFCCTSAGCQEPGSAGQPCPSPAPIKPPGNSARVPTGGSPGAWACSPASHRAAHPHRPPGLAFPCCSRSPTGSKCGK